MTESTYNVLSAGLHLKYIDDSTNMNTWYDLIETSKTGNTLTVILRINDDNRMFFLSKGTVSGMTTSCARVGGNFSWTDAFVPNISTAPAVINFSVDRGKWVMNLGVSTGTEYFKALLIY